MVMSSVFGFGSKTAVPCQTVRRDRMATVTVLRPKMACDKILTASEIWDVYPTPICALTLIHVHSHHANHSKPRVLPRFIRLISHSEACCKFIRLCTVCSWPEGRTYQVNLQVKLQEWPELWILGCKCEKHLHFIAERWISCYWKKVLCLKNVSINKWYLCWMHYFYRRKENRLTFSSGYKRRASRLGISRPCIEQMDKTTLGGPAETDD